MNDSPFLTVQDVSKELQIHEMTVYRLFKSKKLPGFKIGGGWRIKREHFEKLVENGVK